ncbi:hypothetical protein [Salegentibacter chungangensis]|uniref:O-antigen ligase domain-containing protein n=1 Tax=Salegentibacter chungangensis TaxID=1335724 RepID=A0ABW3NLV9_9FLAO
MDFNTKLILNIIEALCFVPFLYMLTQYIFKKLAEKHDFFSIKLMNRLFFYHLFFGAVYYTYALFNPSDSKRYFRVPDETSHSWSHFFETGTHFIDFVSYPFIKYLGFTYEMMMLMFTWVGFLGFVYAYLFFKENISFKINVFKRIDLLTLILFLPNMHFWTSSLGKGAPIFLGLMMFAYAITKPEKRLISLVAGSLLVFSIRPHIFLLMAVGALVGLMLCRHSISWQKKMTFFGVIAVILLIFQKQILSVVHLNNSTNLIADFVEFTSNRAEKLDNAGSGVNMTDYSLAGKFFTFWFRPLFFDAPGILGIIVSIENLIYLLLFGKIFKISFLKFLKKAPAHVKMSLALFLLTSFAMTFVMSNLGIIMRQKSMIMYFLFFVIYYFLAEEKGLTIKMNTNRHQPERLKNAA